jgi:hypothetical protein
MSAQTVLLKQFKGILDWTIENFFNKHLIFETELSTNPIPGFTVGLREALNEF